MLRVSLLGNLGADPELRYSQKGSPMVSFRVAVNQVRTGPDGERQENTEWFRVRVMGRQTEFAQRLTKGTRVYVAGRLDISHYQSRDGEARVGFDVFADELQNVSARTATLDESDPEAIPAATAAPAGAAANGTRARARADAESSDLEDLPF
ncbi:MAG: single-stranded DNA-binding protein [Chloroflexi bacterium]|nr:single-stranded DNA-binding protein [Chloroflexota bacterium]